MKVFIFILALALFSFGCNYELREIPKSKENTSSSQSNTTSDKSETKDTTTSDKPVEDDGVEGGTLLFSDTGVSNSYPCKKREVEFDKDSTANVITLTGECKKITVDGVSNKVFVEKVGQIIVRGISNKVTYESGIGGGKPKISVSGTSTSAKQKETVSPKEGSESEERKPKE